MRVKRYVAESIQEAITRVKNDLGRNAIILHTKPFKEGGFLGLFCRRRFEVIAAVDENIADELPVVKTAVKKPDKLQYANNNLDPAVPVQPLSQSTPSPNNPAIRTAPLNVAPLNNLPEPSVFVPASTVVLDQAPVATSAFTPLPVTITTEAKTLTSIRELSAATEPALKSLKEEIAEMKEMIRQFKPTHNGENPLETTRALDWLRHYLQQLGMEEEIIDYLVLQIPGSLADETHIDEAAIINHCQRILAGKLMFSEPILADPTSEQQIIALIGPTGVGKTTTIAKLAANFNLFEGKKVGLITIDTYRIAAVEHLKTYGDIINLPVEVVYTPSDLNQSFHNLRECDLILIDTAGRSPHNQTMMDELKKFLAYQQIGVILLVISATTKFEDMMMIAENFARISFTHLLFTKLDETSSLGPIVSLALKTKRPISYLTTGQNVPDDIELAKPEKFIAQLFKGFVNG